MKLHGLEENNRFASAYRHSKLNVTLTVKKDCHEKKKLNPEKTGLKELRKVVFSFDTLKSQS